MKLLGRWTRADLSGGFDLLETDDAKKLFEFAYMWGTLMELEITPVLDDQELKAAWKAPPTGFRRGRQNRRGKRLSNTPPDKQRGFAGKPPKKCSVLDLSFHLRSSGNSLSESVLKRNHRGTQIKEEFIMINFNNLIVGRHESRVLFMWNPKEEVAMLGAFIGIKDGIDAILSGDRITPAQRVILEEFRAIAVENSWDFATLRDSLS